MARSAGVQTLRRSCRDRHAGQPDRAALHSIALTGGSINREGFQRQFDGLLHPLTAAQLQRRGCRIAEVATDAETGNHPPFGEINGGKINFQIGPLVLKIGAVDRLLASADLVAQGHDLDPPERSSKTRGVGTAAFERQKVFDHRSPVIPTPDAVLRANVDAIEDHPIYLMPSGHGYDRLTLIHGVAMSTGKKVVPACVLPVAPARTSMNIQLACWALAVQVFKPSMAQLSPSGGAPNCGAEIRARTGF